MASSPLVSVMVWFRSEGAETMGSPLLPGAMTARSEPAPLAWKEGEPHRIDPIFPRTVCVYVTSPSAGAQTKRWGDAGAVRNLHAGADHGRRQPSVRPGNRVQQTSPERRRQPITKNEKIGAGTPGAPLLQSPGTWNRSESCRRISR